LRGGDLEFERRAGMPMPDFDCIDAMPMRTLATREQKIDRRGDRACRPYPTLARKRRRKRDGGVAKGFAVMPTFRMRLQIQNPDHIGGGEHSQRLS
jgi:hypothetical protein